MNLDLRIKHNTVKLLEDNIGENLCSVGFGNEFLNTTLKARSMKEKIDNVDLPYLQCPFCERRCSNNGKKSISSLFPSLRHIFSKHISKERFACKVFKKLVKLYDKKTHSPNEHK